MSNVNDKHGEPIKQGDDIDTPIRGGVYEGNVEKVVMDDVAASEKDAKNPPKVRHRHSLDTLHGFEVTRKKANRPVTRSFSQIRRESR